MSELQTVHKAGVVVDRLADSYRQHMNNSEAAAKTAVEEWLAAGQILAIKRAELSRDADFGKWCAEQLPEYNQQGLNDHYRAALEYYGDERVIGWSKSALVRALRLDSPIRAELIKEYEGKAGPTKSKVEQVSKVVTARAVTTTLTDEANKLAAEKAKLAADQKAFKEQQEAWNKRDGSTYGLPKGQEWWKGQARPVCPGIEGEKPGEYVWSNRAQMWYVKEQIKAEAPAKTVAKMDRKGAQALVIGLCGQLLLTTDGAQYLCRVLLQRFHPDREGGSAEITVQLNQAKEALS